MSNVNFPELEKKILKFWEKEKVFKKFQEKNRDKIPWSFLDGPITANNPMGVHHAWGRTYKDLFQRWKSMQGFDQRFQNGFDCQGLHLEVEVERELRFRTKKDIEKYGLANFSKDCRTRAEKYSSLQTKQSKRLGQWMDWENSYYTMSDKNIEYIWQFLKKCHEKKWLYKDFRVLPWCKRCGTSLSQHEVAEGYKELKHKAVYLKLKIYPASRRIQGKNTYFLVWTTTPWTLTSNVALAVHPRLDYVKVAYGNEYLILAKNRLNILSSRNLNKSNSNSPQPSVGRLDQIGTETERRPSPFDKRGCPKGDSARAKRVPIWDETYKIVDEFKGKDLIGLTYLGPFDELAAQKGIIHKVIPWKEVAEAEGTGIVHIAPGCGEEDYNLGKIHNLPVIAPLDENGIFLKGFGALSGEDVEKAGTLIFKDLKEKHILFKTEEYFHRYPTCWRCQTELVFRLVDEWFIKVDEIRPLMKKEARKARWIPESVGKRMQDWLLNMGDWNISRKRYWGLPLMFFKCPCGGFEVIGTRKELKDKAVEPSWVDKLPELHRPWVDKIKIKCPKCKKPVERIKEVGDCWLDAGIIPFSTLKYFEDKNYWRKWFPVELICEMRAQVRTWYYSLLFISVTLEGCVPFKNVFSHEEVRDEKGRPMHKSTGNVIWFDEAIQNLGADVIRWMYLAQNPAFNLNFSYGGAKEIREKINTLWNTYKFFVTYAGLTQRAAAYSPLRLEGHPHSPSASGAPLCVQGRTGSRSSNNILDKWIVSELNMLIDSVTLKLDEYDVTGAIRDIEGFIDDLSNWYVRRSRRRFREQADVQDQKLAFQTLYLTLVELVKLLAPFTPFITEEIYRNLTNKMSVHLCDWPKANKKLIDKGLNEKMALVRQIVGLGLAARAKAGIKIRQPLGMLYVICYMLYDELVGLIRDELNIKEVEFTKKIKGAKGWVIETDGKITVALDTRITKELKEEGLAREIVRQIQTLRKAAGYKFSDKILVYFVCKGRGAACNALKNLQDYIEKETISKLEKVSEKVEVDEGKEMELEGERLWLGVKKS